VWLNYGTDSVNNKFDHTQVQAINAAYTNYNTYYSMICLLKLPNSCSKKYKRRNLNHLFITTKNVFPPTDIFLWIQIKIQANDAQLCYWMSKKNLSTDHPNNHCSITITLVPHHNTDQDHQGEGGKIRSIC